MTEHEFMPEMDDDDPVRLPDGENYTVGQIRADPKLQRRVTFAFFIETGLRERLVRIMKRLASEPDFDQRKLLAVMREQATAVALAALDLIEGVDHHKRVKGGKSPRRRQKIRCATLSKHDGRWLTSLNEIVKANRTLSDREVARRIVYDRHAALVSEFDTVYSYVRKRRLELTLRNAETS